jgi:hypothetical protein
VKTQQPIRSDGEHRVLQFRPRPPSPPPAQWEEPRRQAVQNAKHKNAAPEPYDLSRYEQDREDPDDFRQRMLANIAGFAFTVALTAIGIWLVVSIADLRRTQDCVLMGRRDCAQITSPHL